MGSNRANRHCRHAWFDGTGLAAAAYVILISLMSWSGLAAAREAISPIIDLHVHTAGIGAGASGCFIAPSMRDSYKFRWYLRAFGTNADELQRRGDAIVMRRIAQAIEQSTAVDQAVVLALDGIIDANGALDREATQVYVPNEFVERETARYEQLLFGASVNPHRTDALARLEQAKRGGALLVKWIPALMNIDPADERLIPFYHKLIELDLPLLTHAGQERSFGPLNDALGDPGRLVLPLRLGVTVIAAHIATTGESDGEDNFERLLPMFSQYPTLYTDISSLTQINKLGFLARALRYPAVVERMVYGSDWPLQFFPLVSPWYQLGRAPIATLWQVRRLKNQWDRDVALKRAMGVPEAVFARARQLLN